MTTAIGVDVGGTKTAAGLVDATGAVRERVIVPTPAADGPEAVLDAIAGLVDRLRTPEATGVGIGTGGVVDHANGVVVSATGAMPGWAGTAVADEVTRRTGLPVAVDNDVNAHALGELAFGAARGLDSVLVVAVGTGVGGGIIGGGRLVRGARHTAGEVGHVPVPGADGMPCPCGRTGHLEAIASGPAMAARYGGGADLRTVAERARAGDARAAAVIAEGGRAVGRAIGGLANTLDPQAVVVGGGVAEIGEAYWGPLRAAVRENTLPALAGLEIRPAGLRNDAGIAGAAALMMNGGTA